MASSKLPLQLSLALLVLSAVACSWQRGGAVNPGFRTVITSSGLDYLNKMAGDLIKEKLKTTSIPSISRKTNISDYITINYTVSNFKVKELKFNSSISSGKNGLTLSITNASLGLSGQWSFRQLEWPYVKDSGTAEMTAGGVAMSLSVNVTANKTDGHLELNSTACSFSVGYLTIIFHGGASWFYNLFSFTINDLLKKELCKTMCSVTTKEVNTAGNKFVSSIQVLSHIGEKVSLSYALVRDPTFKSGYIIGDHKGEFFLTAQPDLPPPFQPPLLPPPQRNGTGPRMFYALASTYMANSAGFAFWKAGLMKYNISSDKVCFICCEVGTLM